MSASQSTNAASGSSHNSVALNSVPGVLRAAYDITLVDVRADGIVDAGALDAAMAGEGRAVVAIQWCNSETGICQPIATLAERIHAMEDKLLPEGIELACQRILIGERA